MKNNTTKAHDSQWIPIHIGYICVVPTLCTHIYFIHNRQRRKKVPGKNKNMHENNVVKMVKRMETRREKSN